MKELMPDGIGAPFAVVTTAARSKLAKRVQQSKREYESPRCQQKASFLLAALKTDYEKNRSSLLSALGKCGQGEDICDEDTVQYVVALFREGHREVLPSLFIAGAGSDGAVSAALGDFYHDVLLQDSRLFIRELTKLSIEGRTKVCFLAVSGDGSGVSDQDAHHAAEILQAVDSEVASSCGVAFRDGSAAAKRP